MPAVKRMWVFKLGAGLKGLRNHLGSKEEELVTAAGKEPTKKNLQSGSKTSCFFSYQNNKSSCTSQTKWFKVWPIRVGRKAINML